MRVRMTILLALVLATSLTTAGGDYTPRAYENFIKASAFPFVAGKERVAKVRAGFPELRRCMSPDEVRRLMGDPDYGSVLYGQGTTEPVMLQWSYVLGMPAPREFKTGARAAIWMHLNGKVRAASVHGIPGLVGLDGMAGESCS